MDRDGATEQDLHFSTAGEVALNTDDMAAAVGGGVPNPTGFDPMEEQQVAVMSEKDMWVDRDEDSLLDMNEASIFYDDFPPLPDFPCMSSSSSSSSTQPPSKPMAGTSSSSSATSSSPVASWAMLRSDAEEDTARVKMEVAAAALSSTASMEIQPPSSEHDGDGLGDVDCVDVMENFRYMDLIDCNELWDPSSVFLEDQQAAEQAVAPPVEGNEINYEEDNDGFSFLQGNSELAMIFFEWLKQNKDYISAEDMRSIKLKRSTIESASKRLGSSKEGKKQLLKLILEWVEQYQLQKSARLREGGAAQSPFSFEETVQIPDPNANPNFMYNPPVPPVPHTTFPTTTQWMQPPPSPEMVEAPLAFAPPMPGYSSDPYSMNHGVVNGIPYQQHSAEYPVMEHAPPWAFLVQPPPSQFSPFPDNGSGIINRQQNVYGNPCQMYDPNGERMRRLGSSATKEARKKRMARQRKLYPHHHRHSSNSNQLQNQLSDPHLVGDGVVDDGDQGSTLGDWLYWSQGGAASSSPTAMNVPPADAPPPNSGDGGIMQPQTSQLQASSDRRQQQGLKTEKNLKFLLQKVLKQSDVGNLGRIVLPKKEAESHLPELETRDGISIAMEDIGTSRIWNMRYRFWPNNKSRMYLLENTGDFVRVNGLQEGDFIVIYSDTKCGKYMIRGVKVRQPGGKLKGKKPVRRNIRNLSSLAGNSSSLAPLRQAVR